MKKIVYCDMDGVLANFWEGLGRPKLENEWDPPEMFKQGFFRNLPLMPGAKDGMHMLLANPGLDVYIASKPTSKNLYCATEKMEWLQEHFPELLERVFLTCDKTHLRADGYLIDDDLGRWGSTFPGTFIHFNETNPSASWSQIVTYFEKYRP